MVPASSGASNAKRVCTSGIRSVTFATAWLSKESGGLSRVLALGRPDPRRIRLADLERSVDPARILFSHAVARPAPFAAQLVLQLPEPKLDAIHLPIWLDTPSLTAILHWNPAGRSRRFPRGG